MTVGKGPAPDLQGGLSISLTRSNHEDDYVTVTLSQFFGTRSRVVRIKVPLLEWAKASFGLSEVPVDYKLYEKREGQP